MIADARTAVKRSTCGKNFICIQRDRKTSNRESSKSLQRAAYHELYGVLSNGDTLSDAEFTSLIP
jgi:hypothetical protein